MARKVKFGTKPTKPKNGSTDFNFGANVKPKAKGKRSGTGGGS